MQIGVQIKNLHAAARLVAAHLPRRRDRRQSNTVLRQQGVAHYVSIHDQPNGVPVGPEVEGVAAPALDPIPDPRPDGDVVVE